MIFTNFFSYLLLLASPLSAQVLQFTLVSRAGAIVRDGRPLRNFMLSSEGSVYPISSSAVQGPASQLLANEAFMGTAAYSVPTSNSSYTDYVFAARSISLQIAKRPAGFQNFSSFSVICLLNISATYSDLDIDFRHNLLGFVISKTLFLYDISVNIESPILLDKLVRPSGIGITAFPNGVSINKYLFCTALDAQGLPSCTFECFDISTGKFGPAIVVQDIGQTGGSCSICTVEVYDDVIATGTMNYGNFGYNYNNPNSVFIWDRATFKFLRAIRGQPGWRTNFFRAGNTLVWANHGDYKFGAISLVNVATAPYVISSFTTQWTHTLRWFGKYFVVFSEAVPVSYYTLKIDGNSITQADTDQANYGYFTPTLTVVNNASVAFMLSSGNVSISNTALYVRDTYAENSFAYVRYTVVKMPSYLTFANTQLSSEFTNAHLANNVSLKINPTLYSSAGSPKTDNMVFLASNGRGASLTVTVSINILSEVQVVTVTSPEPQQTSTTSISDASTVSDESSASSSDQGNPTTTDQSNMLSSFISQNIAITLALVAIFFVAIVAAILALILRIKATSAKKKNGNTGFDSTTHLGTHLTSTQTAGTDMKTVGNTAMPMAFPAYLDIEPQFVRPIRKVGGGGAGSVFEAQLLSPDLIARFGCGKVALKVMDRDSASSASAFQNEMIIMANFSGSRNIAKVYGFLASTNSLVMKLYEGTLGNWCFKYSARPDFMDALPLLVRDVACGLAELHAKKICHNDIKPANILIDHVDGSLVAVLTDFGIASFLETDMEVKALKPVLVKGLSLCYASPECLVSFQTRTLGAVIKPELAYARDVYALSMTAFECLCGNPFARKCEQEILAFIGNGYRPTFDAPLVPSMTDSRNWTVLVDLIQQCWAQDPRDRPTAAFVAKYLN